MQGVGLKVKGSSSPNHCQPAVMGDGGVGNVASELYLDGLNWGAFLRAEHLFAQSQAKAAEAQRHCRRRGCDLGAAVSWRAVPYSGTNRRGRWGLAKASLLEHNGRTGGQTQLTPMCMDLLVLLQGFPRLAIDRKNICSASHDVQRLLAAFRGIKGCYNTSRGVPQVNVDEGCRHCEVMACPG